MTASPWRARRAPFLLAAVGFLLVATRLRIGLGYDESCSWWVIAGGWDELAARLRFDSAPPFYFILLKLWTGIFGDSEPALRALSVIAYLLLVPAMRALALAWRRGSDDRNPHLPLTAAALAIISPVAIAHAASARMYALYALLGTLSLAALFALLADRPGTRRAATLGFIAAAVAGLLTHYWFGFLLLAEITGGVLFAPPGARNHLLTAAVVISAVGAVMVMPLMLTQLANGLTTHYYLPPPTVMELVMVLAGLYTISLPGFSTATALGLAAVLVAAAVRLLRRQASSGAEFDRRRWWLLAWIGIVTLLVPWLVSRYQLRIFIPARYGIIVLPVAALALAELLTRAFRPKTVAVLIFISAAAVLAGERYLATHALTFSDRETARLLALTAAPEDTVIVATFGKVPVEYYFSRRFGAPAPELRSFPAVRERHPGWIRTDEEKPEEMEGEARGLVAGFRDSGRSRLWLVVNESETASQALLAAADAALRSGTLLDYRTDRRRWYTVIREYHR